jgi:hypothetical protein
LHYANDEANLRVLFERVLKGNTNISLHDCWNVFRNEILSDKTNAQPPCRAAVLPPQHAKEVWNRFMTFEGSFGGDSSMMVRFLAAVFHRRFS